MNPECAHIGCKESPLWSIAIPGSIWTRNSCNLHLVELAMIARGLLVEGQFVGLVAIEEVPSNVVAFRARAN